MILQVKLSVLKITCLYKAVTEIYIVCALRYKLSHFGINSFDVIALVAERGDASLMLGVTININISSWAFMWLLKA